MADEGAEGDSGDRGENSLPYWPDLPYWLLYWEH